MRGSLIPGEATSRRAMTVNDYWSGGRGITPHREPDWAAIANRQPSRPRWGIHLAGRLLPVLVRASCRRAESNGRRDGDHPSVIATHDLPAPLVHHPVMPVAEQGEVGLFIVATMQPVLDVMSGRPARRPFAHRPGAASVADVERLAPRSLDRALGPPDIDHLRLGVEHDAGDRGVAGQPLHRLGGDGLW